MLNIVEIGAEVKIKNACLVSHNRFSHPVDRLMCCPMRPVSVRSRLKVSFEYRLQDELERSLDYTVSDAGDGQCELHKSSVRIWDGRKSAIHFIRFEGSALKCSRSDP